MDVTPKCKRPMSKDEVMLFVDLVQNMPVLTSKETNATTNKLKEEAWSRLTDSYNSKSGSVPRTKEQLKLKWDNLKKASRKRAQNIRMNAFKTGGGKPDFIPPDEILDKVAGMMGSTCTGFAVPFGGDGFQEDENYDLNMIQTNEPDHVPDGALPQTPELTDFLPNGEEDLPNLLPKKKRKINFSLEGEDNNNYKPKCLYGMPTMSNSLKNKGKKKSDDGRLQKNLAITRYFDNMSEKVKLEISLLKIELQKKQNDIKQ